MFSFNNAQPSKILGQKSCCTSWDIHNLKQFAPKKKKKQIRRASQLFFDPCFATDHWEGHPSVQETGPWVEESVSGQNLWTWLVYSREKDGKGEYE